ncbi:cytochrome-c oxidase [Sediminibacillus dalangtanensis]|uniref:Cytochrome-c oxidase n=1 Tax=Sediminibacillus dalangtanensis TaxID=2729421 RepID=A0ABX7VRN7_9BACI|nr:cytochrome-c oxidase [Sediminibacillus dalangtanensis]QTM99587.1 cytochrome-c oxidase [Sediminibacillus dalangtanensis]
MGIRLIKISVIYFLVGVCLGYYMSIAHQYTLTGVHVHINLLGWTALTLAGLIYFVFPSLSENKLGVWHFWLHNLGLPVMILSLTIMLLTGNTALTAGVAIGATLVVIAVFLFALNVILHLNEKNSKFN